MDLLHEPQPGSELTAQAYALTRKKTSDLLVCGMMPNQLSHTGQESYKIIFNSDFPLHHFFLIFQDIVISCLSNFKAF